ncbi:MAG: hypothetical protein KatS3mg076_0275 [Candidatus Binatia bacterium]|nr:MAG: hypothetical protein KatS3mg076_0275 [Candidatus Binatia bacterium]
MTKPLSDTERVRKLIERVRLLVAIDDEMPAERKLEIQPLLKMFERAAVDEEDPELAARYYGELRLLVAGEANLEALLSAVPVFLPYLR